MVNTLALKEMGEELGRLISSANLTIYYDMYRGLAEQFIKISRDFEIDIPEIIIDYTNLKKETNNMFKNKTKFYRGDIYFISSLFDNGSPGRPAVIVSNDVNNEKSENLQVVYLSAVNDKPFYPFHISIDRGILFEDIERYDEKMQNGAVMCETITTISKERVSSKRIGRLSATKMSEVDSGIKIQLGFEPVHRKHTPFHMYNNR